VNGKALRLLHIADPHSAGSCPFPGAAAAVGRAGASRAWQPWHARSRHGSALAAGLGCDCAGDGQSSPLHGL